MSGASDHENKIEKKLRNAKEILFKMFLFYLAEASFPCASAGPYALVVTFSSAT